MDYLNISISSSSSQLRLSVLFFSFLFFFFCCHFSNGCYCKTERARQRSKERDEDKSLYVRVCVLWHLKEVLALRQVLPATLQYWQKRIGSGRLAVGCEISPKSLSHTVRTDRSVAIVCECVRVKRELFLLLFPLLSSSSVAPFQYV